MADKPEPGSGGDRPKGATHMTAFLYRGNNAERHRTEILKDPLTRRHMTRSQVNDFIDANATDIPSIRNILKRLAWAALVNIRGT